MTIDPASVIVGILLGAALSQAPVLTNNIVDSPGSDLEQSQSTAIDLDIPSTKD